MQPPGELVACHTCGLVQRLEVPTLRRKSACGRCGSALHKYNPNSRTITSALALAALFLYVPANIYPVMIMEYMGRHSESTVWGGVKHLYQDGMWFVATIVFVASMLVPLLKLMGLFFLVSSGRARWQRERTWIYKTIVWIGPWAMLDVFLLAVLVALIRFGNFATVIPGAGIVAFTLVVILTILASSSFDPRVIWKENALETANKS